MMDDYEVVAEALGWDEQGGGWADRGEFEQAIETAVKARGFNSVRELANILQRPGFTL